MGAVAGVEIVLCVLSTTPGQIAGVAGCADSVCSQFVVVASTSPLPIPSLQASAVGGLSATSAVVVVFDVW